MKKGLLSIVLTFVLLIVLPGQITAKEQKWRFTDFRAIQHDDFSLTVDGIMENPTAGEVITVRLSSSETLLSETKGFLNTKGYFRVKTPPVNTSMLSGNKISISVIDKEGQKTGSTQAFPVSLKANDPDLFSRRDEYAKYMDSSQLVLSLEESRKLGHNAVKLAKRLVAGDRASYFLDDHGKLWGWGQLLGIFDKTAKSFPVVWRLPKGITTVPNVAQVSVGGQSGALLTKQGEIWQWDYRSADTGLVRIGKFSGVKEIAINNEGNGLILKQDGTVHSWTLTYGKSGLDGKYPAPKITVKAMASLTGITSIVIAPYSMSGQSTHLALQKNGTVWAWGDLSVIASARQAGNTNENKALQDGLSRYLPDAVISGKPEQLKGFPPIIQIALYGGYPLLVSDDLELWSYLSTEDTFIKKPGKVSHGVAAVFQNSSYVLGTDGRYYEWNPGSQALVYEPVAMLDGFQSLSQGATAATDSKHSLAVNAEGNLVSWGYNSSGQLGISASPASPTEPYLISKVANAVSIASSEKHILALGSDGTVYGWGSNSNGQINGSARKENLSPVVITKAQGIKKLGAGNGFSLYLDQKGKLYGWGDLERLGLEPAATPTHIDSIAEAIQDIAVSESSVVVLGVSGQVYQLGAIVYLGDKAGDNRSNYVRSIAPITDATAIAMGRQQGYAARKDGTVWIWDTIISEKSAGAKQITGLKNIKLLAAGTANDDYLLALDKSGELWGWGDNTASQLGRHVKQTLTPPVNLTKEPFRLSEASWTSVKKKLEYRAISASSRGALLLTSNNEMLFFGYSSYSLLAKKLHLNVSFAEPQGSNYYFIIGGRLYVNGGDNTFGQIGNGTKSYFDQPQPIRTIDGAKLNASAG